MLYSPVDADEHSHIRCSQQGPTVYPLPSSVLPDRCQRKQDAAESSGRSASRVNVNRKLSMTFLLIGVILGIILIMGLFIALSFIAADVGSRRGR